MTIIIALSGTFRERNQHGGPMVTVKVSDGKETQTLETGSVIGIRNADKDIDPAPQASLLWDACGRFTRVTLTARLAASLCWIALATKGEGAPGFSLESILTNPAWTSQPRETLDAAFEAQFERSCVHIQNGSIQFEAAAEGRPDVAFTVAPELEREIRSMFDPTSRSLMPPDCDVSKKYFTHSVAGVSSAGDEYHRHFAHHLNRGVLVVDAIGIEGIGAIGQILVLLGDHSLNPRHVLVRVILHDTALFAAICTPLEKQFANQSVRIELRAYPQSRQFIMGNTLSMVDFSHLRRHGQPFQGG